MLSYPGRGVHGQTVEEVGRRIVSGKLGAGTTIEVATMRADLGVSLTAMREALKVLAAKGLVGARQKRGTFVRPRTDWHLLDADVIRWELAGPADPAFLANLHQLRTVIEPACAAIAARQRTELDVERLEEALATMEAGTDIAAAVESDLGFHRALLGATGNELMARMEPVLAAGLAERDRVVHTREYEDEARDSPVRTHRAVLEAVRARDPDAAEGAMHDLLAKAAHDLEHPDTR